MPAPPGKPGDPQDDNGDGDEDLGIAQNILGNTLIESRSVLLLYGVHGCRMSIDHVAGSTESPTAFSSVSSFFNCHFSDSAMLLCALAIRQLGSGETAKSVLAGFVACAKDLGGCILNTTTAAGNYHQEISNKRVALRLARFGNEDPSSSADNFAVFFYPLLSIGDTTKSYELRPRCTVL